MGRRTDLHNLLCDLLETFGIWIWDEIHFEEDTIHDAIEEEARRHVYFDPPENLRLKYPCIVYKLSRINSTYANNKPYTHDREYELTVISRKADSPIPGKVSDLPKCRHMRHFVNDNLHHDVFRIRW